jgi:dihydrofolate reductase
MKTVLYGSISANGGLAEASPDHPIAPEVLADFVGRVGTTGNLIVGRRTHQMVLALGAGAMLAGSGADLVVLSTGDQQAAGAEVVADPAAAMQHLAERGHDAALVGGGAATYRSFLRAGLVDELVLNILPELTDRGLDMALPAGEHAGVELEAVTSLAPAIVQLRYRVRRQPA